MADRPIDLAAFRRRRAGFDRVVNVPAPVQYVRPRRHRLQYGKAPAQGSCTECRETVAEHEPCWIWINGAGVLRLTPARAAGPAPQSQLRAASPRRNEHQEGNGTWPSD